MFVARVALICQLIIGSLKGLRISGYHLLSIDEKTGIQALERKQLHMKAARQHRSEFEYKRNGTICLLAALDVATGQLSNYQLKDTRTEEVFLHFIKQTVNKYPGKDRIVILLDHLNTHMSASLVAWIAEQIGDEQALGKKRKTGILENKQTRLQYLENPKHRIQFVFTPIHCSWLNPIENWFSKLQRHVIKRGNFNSVENLISKIEAYIKYYNININASTILKWKFTGFDKGKPLAA